MIDVNLRDAIKKARCSTKRVFLFMLLLLIVDGIVIGACYGAGLFSHFSPQGSGSCILGDGGDGDVLDTLKKLNESYSVVKKENIVLRGNITMMQNTILSLQQDAANLENITSLVDDMILLAGTDCKKLSLGNIYGPALSNGSENVFGQCDGAVGLIVVSVTIMVTMVILVLTMVMPQLVL